MRDIRSSRRGIHHFHSNSGSIQHPQLLVLRFPAQKALQERSYLRLCHLWCICSVCGRPVFSKRLHFICRSFSDSHGCYHCMYARYQPYAHLRRSQEILKERQGGHILRYAQRLYIHRCIRCHIRICGNSGKQRLECYNPYLDNYLRSRTSRVSLCSSPVEKIQT